MITQVVNLSNPSLLQVHIKQRKPRHCIYCNHALPCNHALQSRFFSLYLPYLLSRRRARASNSLPAFDLRRGSPEQDACARESSAQPYLGHAAMRPRASARAYVKIKLCSLLDFANPKASFFSCIWVHGAVVTGHGHGGASWGSDLARGARLIHHVP